MKDLGSTQNYSFEYDNEKLRTTSKSSLSFTDTLFSDIEELKGMNIENDKLLRNCLKEHIENGLEYFQRIVTIKGFGNSINVRLFSNEINFQHITTGDWQEDLDQCFVGWSEQEESEQKKWEMLRNSIESMIENDMLDQYIYDYEAEGEFNIEETPYNINKN